MGRQDQWVFDASKPADNFSELAQFFGAYVTGWRK